MLSEVKDQKADRKANSLTHFSLPKFLISPCHYSTIHIQDGSGDPCSIF